MGNCQALLIWPEEIMKILHAVFTAVALILLIAPAGGMGAGFDDIGFLGVLLCMVLTAACIILIWFIFADPRSWKGVLLMYYVLACTGTGACFFFSLIRWHYGGSGYMLGIWICSLAAFVCYAASAYFNGIGGKA